MKEKRNIFAIILMLILAWGCKGKATDEKGVRGSESEKERKLTASAGEESGIEEEEQEVKTESNDKEKKHSAEVTKKILMVIACDGFRDEELKKPKELFESEGMKVTVASNKKSGCKGMLGASAEVDAIVSEINIKDFDGVVFVGGVGAKIFFNDNNALKIAKEAFENNKVIGAICIAPSILANAGILKGKKATVWEGNEFISLLEKGGAVYTSKNVVIDGKIVTANGPQSASEFGQTIINLLKQ